MEFPVPKFIEMETKIVGPLTWRQFAFVGTAGVIIFFLYFILKQRFLIFIIISLILGVSAIGFAFLKVGGRPLPSVLINFVFFNVSSKIYTWKRKSIEPRLVYKKERVKAKKEKKEPAALLKITKQSRLKELSTQIELKTK